MELRQLRYLISIIDFGSFSRASGQLNVAQPALSQQIANLEAELETPLLIRSARGVVPTEAGERLYRQAQSILAQVDQAKSEARLSSFDEQFTGPVSVGLPTSTSTILALPLLQRLAETYPRIRLHLVESLSGHLLEMLLKNRIDLALQFSDEAVTGLQVEPLIVEDLFFVSDDEETDGVPIRFAELAGRTVTIPGRPHAMRTAIDRYCAEFGVELNVIADVDSLPALRRLAAAGVATAILPQSALFEPTSAGPLYSRPIIEPPVSRPISLCRSEGAPRSRAVEATEEIIRFLIRDLIEEGTWTGVRMNPELAGRLPDKGLRPKRQRKA